MPEAVECHFKELSEEKYLSGYAFVRDRQLVVLEKIAGSIRVHTNLPVRSVMHMGDKSDPRKLIISARTDAGQGRSNTSLMFKDAKTAYNFKTRIEDLKLQGLRFEFTEMVKHIERCADDPPLLK